MWNVRLFLLGFIFFVNQNSYAKEIAAEVVSVNGIAFLRPDKTDGPAPKSPPRAKPGDNVYVGDVINTSSDGAVKILMRDKTIVDIGSSSLFKVDEYVHNHGNDRKAKVDLVFGKVRFAVTRKIEGEGGFQIKTKGATMGVRGTEFVVDEKQGDLHQGKSTPGNTPKDEGTKVTVVQGKVDVMQSAIPKADGTMTAAPKTVSLTQNMQLNMAPNVSAAGGGAIASAPVTLSATQMKVETQSAKIADNTFAAAITIAPASSSSNESGGRSPASQSDHGPTISLPPIVIIDSTHIKPDGPGGPSTDPGPQIRGPTFKHLSVKIVSS